MDALAVVSGLLGWTYFLCWSLSFYPQPLLNARRRSTAGTTVDFPLINCLGFLCYFLSTAALRYSTVVRAEYAARHHGLPPTAAANDVAFAAHALLLSLVTVSQYLLPGLWGIGARGEPPRPPGGLLAADSSTATTRRGRGRAGSRAAGSRPSRFILGLAAGCVTSVAATVLLVLRDEAKAVHAAAAGRGGGGGAPVRGAQAMRAAMAAAAAMQSSFTVGGSGGGGGGAESQAEGPGPAASLVASLTQSEAAALVAAWIGNGWTWLDAVYALGYVKLVITLVKYSPQLVANWRNRSTAGWSIGQILLDFAGGLLSIAQLLLDSYRLRDWSGVTGNPVKLALGNVSMAYDFAFFLQHYVLYRGAASRKDEEEGEEEEEEAGGANGVGARRRRRRHGDYADADDDDDDGYESDAERDSDDHGVAGERRRVRAAERDSLLEGRA